MERTLRGTCVLLLAVLALAGASSDAFAQTATQQREAAVLKARAGQMAEAQAALRAMLASGTDDGLVAMDLTSLSTSDSSSGHTVSAGKRRAPSRASRAAAS